MAGLLLNTPYTSEQNGVNISTGYAKVTNYRGNEITFSFDVHIWISEEAYNQNLSPIDGKNYSINTSEITGIPFIYEYLSGLPEFSGSVIVQ